MILVVGLGNLGKKFEKTRHNFGFQIIEEMKKKDNFSDFKLLKKFKAGISQGKIDNQKVILAKPQTFMNNSGQAIKLLVTNYSLLVTNLWVVHDDIDLPLGEIKISKGRGSAGHKGVQSIIDELGTKDFVRFRVGIRSKNNKQRTINNIEEFVLLKFNKEEEKILKKVIKETCQAIEMALKENLENAMSKFNK